jgi:cytochrome c oxidase subunit 2
VGPLAPTKSAWLPSRSQSPKRWRRLTTGAVAGAVLLAVSGCSADGKDQLHRLAMPVPRTTEAQHTYDLWHWSWLAAIVTGVLVWGLIFYVVIRYRRRGEDEIPVQTRYNLPIEIFYTVAPVMMVIVFFFFTLKVQDQILPSNEQGTRFPDQSAGAPDTNILAVGQQWSWTFNYVKAIDGKSVYEAGTPADAPTLWLPVDKKVRFDLYSPDVVHSFWVPSFLFKMDVVPGRDNHFTLTPNRVGTYQGRCAEYCGVYHSRMLFNVKVVSAADYTAHLRSLQQQGNNGLAKGAAKDTRQPGLRSENGGTE